MTEEYITATLDRKILTDGQTTMELTYEEMPGFSHYEVILANRWDHSRQSAWAFETTEPAERMFTDLTQYLLDHGFREEA